jgi:hypothetical protein
LFWEEKEMSDTVDDTFQGKSKSLRLAEERINTLGLPLPEQPELWDDANVGWPRNVAELTPHQLAEHLTWWSGWCSYVEFQLSSAETDCENFEANYKHEMNVSLYKSKGDYKTLTEAKASIIQRPDMLKMKQKVQYARALAVQLKSLLSGYELKHSTISREISRRQLEYGRSNGRTG